MRTFTLLRYVLFALFVIFYSITAIVAGWNWTASSQAIGIAFKIDTYLIVINAMGLFLIFPIIFVDILRKGAFTSQVWFEISWTGLFWLLNLCGAAAVTAIEPRLSCSSADNWTDACTSTQALLVTTWVQTIMYLGYLVALVSVSVLSMARQPQIWRTDVRDLPWFSSTSQQRIQSAPPSPVLPIYKTYTSNTPKPMTTFVVPKATMLPQATMVRPVPPIPAVTSASSRSTSFSSGETIVSSSLVKTISRDTTMPPPMSTSANPLYPSVLQSKFPQMQQAAIGPEPLPAGQWPRANPVEPMRKQRPTIQTVASPARGQEPSSATSSPERQTPGGSRSKHRPPPLDLSQLSALNTRRQERRRADK